MQKFPVKIDLSAFFDDERKYVLILVDPQWENVACLQQRIERIFDVEAVRFQTNDNFFIPPQESIEVVKFAEALKAFIPQRSLEKLRRKSKKSVQIETATQPDVELAHEEVLPAQEPALRKRKYYSLGIGLGSSTPNQPKRSKNAPLAGHVTLACGATRASKSHEITSTSEQQPPEAILALLEDQVVVAEEPLAAKTKRKRKRYNKTKSNECDNGDECPENPQYTKDQSSAMTLLSGVPSSTFISQSSKKTMLKYAAGPQAKSHVRLNESKDVDMVSTISTTARLDQPEDATQKNQKSETTNVIFRCSLDDVEAHRPRVFDCKAINAKRKQSNVFIQEQILLPPVADISLLTQKSVCQQEAGNDDSKAVPACSTSDATEQVTTSATVAAQVIDAESALQAEQTAKAAPESENVEEMKLPADEPVDADELVDAKLLPHDETAGGASSLQINDATVDITDNAETSAASDSVLLDESNVIDLDDEENTCCSEPELTEIIDISENEDVDRAANRTARSHNASKSNVSFDPTKMSAEEMLPYSTALEKSPRPGDLLLFKFHRQTNAKKRRSSPFIAGRCEYINRRTQQIKMYLLDFDFAKEHIPHQFAYNLDESSEEKFINVKLCDMIEPRIIEM